MDDNKVIIKRVPVKLTVHQLEALCKPDPFGQLEAMKFIAKCREEERKGKE